MDELLTAATILPSTLKFYPSEKGSISCGPADPWNHPTSRFDTSDKMIYKNTIINL